MKLSEIKLTPVLSSIQILDISDEEYFGDKYKEYISNSKLKYIDPDEGGSPESFFDETHSLSSSSIEFGSAIHQLVLQPDSYMLCDSVSRPTAKMGLMADYLYKIKNRTREEVVNASNSVGYFKGKMTPAKIDKVLSECAIYWKQREIFESTYVGDQIPIFLNAKDIVKLKLCLTSLKANKEIQSILYPTTDVISVNEATVLVDIVATFPEGDQLTLKVKAKFDNFNIDLLANSISLNDLKTTGHLVEEFKTGSWLKYHYYRQAALYSWLLSMLSSRLYSMKNPSLTSNFLLVSTIPNYDTSIYKVSKADFKLGLKEVTKLLKLVAYYKKYGY